MKYWIDIRRMFKADVTQVRTLVVEAASEEEAVKAVEHAQDAWPWDGEEWADEYRIPSDGRHQEFRAFREGLSPAEEPADYRVVDGRLVDAGTGLPVGEEEADR